MGFRWWTIGHGVDDDLLIWWWWRWECVSAGLTYYRAPPLSIRGNQPTNVHFYSCSNTNGPLTLQRTSESTNKLYCPNFCSAFIVKVLPCIEGWVRKRKIVGSKSKSRSNGINTFRFWWGGLYLKKWPVLKWCQNTHKQKRRKFGKNHFWTAKKGSWGFWS